MGAHEGNEPPPVVMANAPGETYSTLPQHSTNDDRNLLHGVSLEEARRLLRKLIAFFLPQPFLGEAWTRTSSSPTAPSVFLPPSPCSFLHFLALSAEHAATVLQRCRLSGADLAAAFPLLHLASRHHRRFTLHNLKSLGNLQQQSLQSQLFAEEFEEFEFRKRDSEKTELIALERRARTMEEDLHAKMGKYKYLNAVSNFYWTQSDWLSGTMRTTTKSLVERVLGLEEQIRTGRLPAEGSFQRTNAGTIFLRVCMKRNKVCFEKDMIVWYESESCLHYFDVAGVGLLVEEAGGSW